MRLIDKKALMYQLHKQSQIDSQPRAIRRARRIVETFPTVEAIPIDFIQKRIAYLHDLAEYEFEASGGYIGHASVQERELIKLVEDWQKEDKDA